MCRVLRYLVESICTLTCVDCEANIKLHSYSAVFLAYIQIHSSND